MTVYARTPASGDALINADDLAALTLSRELRDLTREPYAVYRRDGDYLVCRYGSGSLDSFTLVSVAYPDDSTDRPKS
jgi:hypothetical protein